MTGQASVNEFCPCGGKIIVVGWTKFSRQAWSSFQTKHAGCVKALRKKLPQVPKPGQIKEKAE